MVLDKARGKSGVFLDGVASHLGSVSPSLITLISFILAVAFAVAYYFSYLNPAILLAAFFLLAGSSYLDALDGAVARMFKKETKRGDFLDHLLDRYSDVVILLGMTVSLFGNMFFGIVAISGTLLSSYVGTQSQAVGLGRLYSGFPGRADRLVIILIITLLQLFTLRFEIFGDYITSWGLLFLGLAGFANSVYRASIAYRSIA